MARQTGKNRWVNGNRVMKWFGGSEMSLGHFVVEEKGQQVAQRSCYKGYEIDEAIRLFLACGEVHPLRAFTEDDVLGIIFKALREAKDFRINDVSTEMSGEQIVLTTDNGDQTQRWVIEAASIVETD